MINLCVDEARMKFYPHQIKDREYSAREWEFLYVLAKSGFFHNANEEWLILTAFENGKFQMAVERKDQMTIVESHKHTLVLFNEKHMRGNHWFYAEIGNILTDRSIIYAPLDDNGCLLPEEAITL